MFCHTGLGANEAIEHFPVGRRLAFDAAKGRLWVVCSACERWNLSPIDERWEAIEEAEKLFRDTRLRVSTDNIGLAKLREGTTLIRVGDPQRPEMAAWRYGDQFHRRRRKHLMWVAGGAAVVGGVIVAGPVMGLISGTAMFQIPNVANTLLRQRTVVRVPINGKVVKLSQTLLSSVQLLPNEAQGFFLDIPYKGAGFFAGAQPERVRLRGEAAIQAARLLLPRINRAGGKATDVSEAVDVLQRSRNTDGLFALTAHAAHIRDRRKSIYRSYSEDVRSARSGTLASWPAAVRLALGMSVHEEDERRALEGELAALEDRWREAEEVAAISDDMFLPSGVGAMLKRLKGSSD